jgi:hypothetical protein
MKLLRNPLVVTILAVVAVVMVLYQVFGNKLFRVPRLFAPKPAPVAATPAPKKPVAQPAPAAVAPPPVRAATYTNLEEALRPSQGVDATLIGQRFNSWVTAPARDPFLLLLPVVHEQPSLLTEETNSPVSTWALQGIWNQTGSRLAVINRRVCRVGDVIEPGYKLIRIEKDEVWIQGPNRNERLGFPEPKRVTPKSPLPAGNRT